MTTNSHKNLATGRAARGRRGVRKYWLSIFLWWDPPTKHIDAHGLHYSAVIHFFFYKHQHNGKRHVKTCTRALRSSKTYNLQKWTKTNIQGNGMRRLTQSHTVVFTESLGETEMHTQKKKQHGTYVWCCMTRAAGPANRPVVVPSRPNTVVSVPSAENTQMRLLLHTATRRNAKQTHEHARKHRLTSL